MTTWLRNAVIYEIFIDRFAGYDESADDLQPHFVGGNLRAIIKRLPYLLDLGIDAIWLTPFFKTTDYHGYSTLDFYQVDPHFGTLADAKALVAACHKQGLRVIMDFNANHTSVDHPFFQEALHHPDSPYRAWYYFGPDNSYLGFLDFTSLPKLNLDHGPARDHVIGAAEYWTRELNVDGFRLDHVVGPHDQFWEVFRQRLRQIKPEIVLIGEAVLFGVKWNNFNTYGIPHARYYNLISHVWPYPFDPIMKHYVGRFDGCLDYTFHEFMKRFVRGQLSRAQLERRLAKHLAAFPADYALPLFLDNHDTNRFLYFTNQDYQRLKEVLEIEFGLPQPKIMYYGDEVGMTNREQVHVNTGRPADLPARRKMNWKPTAQEQELLEFYKAQIARSKAK